MYLSELQLITKVDIPFIEAGVVIHQPSIKELAMMRDEENYFLACELLNFSKDRLSEQDKILLEDKTNFDVFMSIMMDRNVVMQKQIIYAKMLLSLIFPNYKITYSLDSIKLELIDNNENEYFIIDNKNYEIFKQILQEMFCIKSHNKEEDFNPGGELAKRIADKIKKGKEEVNRQKNNGGKIAIFSRYISILSVGLKKDKNELANYSVYQLYDEFERFELKLDNDLTIELKLAGAKDVKEVDNWMKDIHS